MKTHHVLLSALAIAFVVLDLATLPREEPPANWILGALIGSCTGQIVLMAAWLVFGRSWFLLRLLGGAVVVGVLSLWLSQFSTPSAASWLAIQGIVFASVGGFLTLLRASGLTVRGAWQKSPPPESTTRSGQFTLAAIFATMTAIAVGLGGAKLAEFPWEHAFAVSLYCVGLIVVGIVSLGCALRLRQVIWQCIVPPLVALAFGFSLGYVENAHEILWLAATIEMLTIAVASIVIRISGYQCAWSFADAPAASPPSAAAAKASKPS